MREPSGWRSIRRLKDPEHRSSAVRTGRISVQDRVQPNAFPVALFLQVSPLLDLFRGGVPGGHSAIQIAQDRTHFEIPGGFRSELRHHWIIVHGDAFADDADAAVLWCSGGGRFAITTRKQQQRGEEDREMWEET